MSKSLISSYREVFFFASRVKVSQATLWGTLLTISPIFTIICCSKYIVTHELLDNPNEILTDDVATTKQCKG